MDMIIEIPMHGMKESLNVSVAAGIALYELSQLNT
jgi:tRNA G18 (ribose-2'-O)-methylase SpoU